MPDKSNGERKLHLCGWVLFLVCAVFAIASSTEDGSMLNLVSSVIFLIAYIIFIIPLMMKWNRL